MVAVPENARSLSLAFGRAYQRYAQIINNRRDWRGHLWEQRFSSIPMDETHLLMAARFVELNSVRARIAESPFGYLWSSARAHLNNRDDELVGVMRLLEMVPDWLYFLAGRLPVSHANKLRDLEKSRYPAGNKQFLENLEIQYGIQCQPKKRGPKPKNVNYSTVE